MENFQSPSSDNETEEVNKTWKESVSSKLAELFDAELDTSNPVLNKITTKRMKNHRIQHEEERKLKEKRKRNQKDKDPFHNNLRTSKKARRNDDESDVAISESQNFLKLREDRLKKVATRGVVSLLNAISKAQRRDLNLSGETKSQRGKGKTKKSKNQHSEHIEQIQDPIIPPSNDKLFQEDDSMVKDGLKGDIWDELGQSSDDD